MSSIVLFRVFRGQVSEVINKVLDIYSKVCYNITIELTKEK